VADAAATEQVTTPPLRLRARRGRSRTPTSGVVKHARLAGIMAVVFAGFYVTGLVMVHSSPGLQASDAAFSAYYRSSSTALVTVGLNFVPFAGIAFLWHMNAIRLVISARTPSPSAMPYGLQLVSGVLFVALLFAGTAAAGSVALLKDLGPGPLPSMDVARGLLGVGYGMVFVYAVRGAGMYAITTTTLLRSAGLLPRWLTVVGYLLAAFLLVSTALNPVVMLLFPAWAVLVGVAVFLRSGRLGDAAAPEKELTA
jgi:hypothetical protein